MKTAPRSEQAGAQGYQIGLRSGSKLVVEARPAQRSLLRSEARMPRARSDAAAAAAKAA